MDDPGRAIATLVPLPPEQQHEEIIPATELMTLSAIELRRYDLRVRLQVIGLTGTSSVLGLRRVGRWAARSVTRPATARCVAG
ncbi:hypothetical protein HNR72_007343 [Streptomyces collinus]|uniref:Uncharacterized protein n=1 Tax=Streptomyces collinus TaxID=42684 RepID=A0AA89QD35_STRCU|nr:hypothetical protein [Streptomyces collinus]